LETLAAAENPVISVTRYVRWTHPGL